MCDVSITKTPILEDALPKDDQHVVEVRFYNSTYYLTRNEAEELGGLLINACYQRELGPVTIHG